MQKKSILDGLAWGEPVWIIFSAFPSHSLHPVIAQPNLRNVPNGVVLCLISTFCVIPSCMSSHQPRPSLLTPTCHHEGLGTTVLPPNLPLKLKMAATDTSATTASLQLFQLFPTFRQLLQMPQAAANMANKPSLA